MKKLLILGIFVCLFSINIFGQINVNFSGVWILDKSKSKLPFGSEAIESMKKIVTQTKTKIYIKTSNKIDSNKLTTVIKWKQPFVKEQIETYDLDGKEKESLLKSTFSEKAPVKKKAGFNSDGNLVIVTTVKFTNPPEDLTYITTEIWQLSDKGSVLKITQRMQTPKKESSNEFMEWVYNRKPKAKYN